MPAPPSTVAYAGSVEQMDEAHAHELVAQNPAMRGFLGAIMRPGAEAAAIANADKSASQYAAHQVQGLGHHITTQPGPDTGGHNYMSYQQEELHQMVNSNADPAAVNEQGQAFNEIGNDLAEIAADLDKATRTASAQWQGEAAQGGAAFTTGMSSWHGATAQGAQYAGTQMFEQSQALGQARTNMPPPVPSPTVADVRNALLSYNPLDSSSIDTLNNLANQAKTAKTNRQMMARVAQQYDSQLGTSATLPTFTTPSQFAPHPQASTSHTSGVPAGASGGSAGWVSSPHSGGGAPAGAPATAGNASGGATGHGGGGYSVPPRVSSNQGSGAQSSTSTQGAAGNYPPGGGWRQPGSSGPYPNGPVGPGGAPDGGMVAMPMGGMPMGGDFGPTGGGGGGYGSARGSSGWGPTGSGGNAVNQGGSGPKSGGERSAAGAAAAEESAVERGAAQARGASGAPGGIGTGRGGRREEDKEHKRAEFLMESDPESVFGTDEKTAPPVIGL